MRGGEQPASVVVDAHGQLAVALHDANASATDMAAALSQELGSLMGSDVHVFQLRTLPMGSGDMAVVALKERRDGSVGISVGTGRGADREVALATALHDALGESDLLAAAVSRLEAHGDVEEVAVMREEAESGPAELRSLTSVLTGDGRLAVTTAENAYRAARLGGTGVALRTRRANAPRIDTWLDAVWDRRQEARKVGAHK